MLAALVRFPPGVGVRVDVGAVRRTNLHNHPNAVEVLYVLRGGLHVMVSCESYDLDAGDFAVLNRDDPHLLEGTDDNVTATIHLDPRAFRGVDPHVEFLCFACESWDLARYVRQEALLRGMLLDVIGSGADATELVRLLCAQYSLESYYNRDARIPPGRRSTFHAIFAATRRNAHRRDVLDVVAEEHHYSKSYVSHIVKDVAAISFTDMLMYLRLATAERLLLTTDATMLDIAAQCGFSDVKYFTRGFVDWYRQTPTDYRGQHRPDVLCDSDVTPFPVAEALKLIAEHRRHVAPPADGPRLAITPLLLKNVGSRADLFEKLRTRGSAVTRPITGSATGPQHLVPIHFDPADLDRGFLLDGLGSFAQINAKPVLVIDYTARTPTFDFVTAVAERIAAASIADVTIWLVYDGSHDRAGVDEVITRVGPRPGLTIRGVQLAQPSRRRRPT